MRRRSVLVAGALLLTTGLVTIPPAAACGCGGMAAEEPVDVVHETAVISLVDGVERVMIELEAITEAPDAALVIPTPTPATAALGDEAVLAALAAAIRPVPRYVDRWWPELGGGGDAGAAPGETQEAAPSSVEVFQEVVLGPLEVVSLGADDAEELTEWLAERGYVLSDGLREGLDDYVAEGWSFVAIRLDPEGETLSGEIPPVELTFAAQELVYPMRLSAAAAVAQQVSTYVFAEGRMDRSDRNGGSDTVRFAGEVTALDHPALASWTEPFGGSAYLTASWSSFEVPHLDITHDFTWEPSAAGDYVMTYDVVRDRKIGPFFAGPVLVAFAVLGLGIGLLTVLARRGRRSAVPAAPRA